ncbi:sulfate ABC transporter permease [Frankia sp. CNm7]|uniref:Sulfate ABC transporter permease n=1 Tax=Frankia nepalensis TaxID=1836974 RepID=A0A937REV6_9ACTN|nr:sulfate ABC transporter permease [Frankia nepalensis]MBL7515457.1 sulfate ABC transporter permease [Frankia nepalensis]MBL7523997.1 sulfate ABC transporter permease [Frankia nepalensis]MBL7630906.1 sulfate ABC transporter permease [Frankia nepalensis]
MREPDDAPKRAPARRAAARRGPLTYVLRLIVIAYLFFLIAWPLYLVGQNAFKDGFGAMRDVLTDADTVDALLLTVQIAAISVVLNTVFGVGISLLLVRYDFPGKRVLNALLDMPLSVSPIVVGLALTLVYNGRSGWFGPALEDAGFQIIFAVPGMVLATTFIALPLVIREVVPVLEEVGDDQEQAARSLGAGAFTTFRRITLPAIKWGVVYGVVLSLARALGEFGAVKVVSGNVLGSTRTATLAVEEKYLNFDKDGAYATSFLLALVAVAAVIVVSIFKPKGKR